MERHLSAILCADVVGYSRLMGANEVGTLERLRDHRAALIDPSIADNGGRLIKSLGDGLLAEFPSVVRAVESAVAIQQGMVGRNRDEPDDRRMDLRIGINLGDVIVEDGDIFGDGVNIAARLEGIAPVGGIALSDWARAQVGDRLPLTFVDEGPVELKNIDKPVNVFTVRPAITPDRSVGGKPDVADRPSIVVLPFTNMSGDVEQDYFSDGITEDIITDLSKLSGLFVIGRHTSFAYKGTRDKLETIATDLGVRFLLEGSVRKVGNRVRITGQLIDGATGGHRWAERYDRELTDIFAIQDEITRTIVDQLKVRLVSDEREAIGRVPTTDVEAYNLFLKGRQFLHNATKYFLGLARQMFSQAIALDPQFARAFAGLANVDSRMIGWYGETLAEERVLANADRAIALDPGLGEAWSARGDALSFFDHRDEAVAAYEKGLALDPGSFDCNYLFARYYTRTGQFPKAIPLYIRALEVQPDDYQAPMMVQQLCRALGRVEEANRYADLGLKRAYEASRIHPEWSRPAQMAAATLAGLGRRGEAMIWLERAMALDPDDGQTLYNAACSWAQLGEPERAFDLLERWLPRAGIEKRLWLRVDNDFDPIRADPRFKALLDRAEQPPAPVAAATEA